MTDHYLYFDLIAQPASPDVGYPDAPEAPEILVIHDSPEHRPFLDRVLAAAGYDDPDSQVYALHRPPAAGPFHLHDLIAKTGVRKIILFGQDLPDLGLHFDVRGYHRSFPNNGYVAATISGVRYLIETSLVTIAEANAAGDKSHARRLWNGLRAGLLAGE